MAGHFWNRIYKPKLRPCRFLNEAGCTVFMPIFKWQCFDGNQFSFINLSSPFISWNDDAKGMLWAYNLNYMDWLLQKDMDFRTGARWIDKFIDESPQNRIGSTPYPIALRGINWIKFISLHSGDIDVGIVRKWNDSLYSQYALLIKRLEYHLLGNHLLEDACSLFIASIYFRERAWYLKASRLLCRELNEQILPDGAHFEQSPMYHCILLDRLLDCCNFSMSNPRFDHQNELTEFLKGKAALMLGHLESIVYSDGTIPLLNDSAYGIAPTSAQIFDYARRLGLEWFAVPLKECGYRKFCNGTFEIIVDVGNVTATYQPGHTHADTFNYELRTDGVPFIVDTGISTYNKTERRVYERSTAAHNTVTINGKNSSEVWSGHRVGNRAKATILGENEYSVTARHDGFGRRLLHTRVFELENNVFHVRDEMTSPSEAVSHIHLAPDVKIILKDSHSIVTDRGTIVVFGAEFIEVKDGKVSDRYNVFHSAQVINIHFKSSVRYEIRK